MSSNRCAVAVVVVGVVVVGAACGPPPKDDPPKDKPTNDLGGIDSAGEFYVANDVLRPISGFFARRTIANDRFIDLFGLSIDDTACSTMATYQRAVNSAYDNNPTGEQLITDLAAADNNAFPVNTVTLHMSIPDDGDASIDVEHCVAPCVENPPTTLEVCQKTAATSLEHDAQGTPFLFAASTCYAHVSGTATITALSESHLKMNATASMEDPPTPPVADPTDLTLAADVLRCQEYEIARDE